MPQAQVVGFCVHWEVFTSCAKQKLVFSADRAAAAAAAAARRLQLHVMHLNIRLIGDSGEVGVIHVSFLGDKLFVQS